MQSAYLDCRMPLAVYTSTGVALPRMHFEDRQGQMRSGTRRKIKVSVKLVAKCKRLGWGINLFNRLIKFYVNDLIFRKKKFCTNSLLGLP